MSCRCPPAIDHLEPPVVKEGGFATHCKREITPMGDPGVSIEGAGMDLLHRIWASLGDWEEDLR